jgi:hypothetical protein
MFPRRVWTVLLLIGVALFLTLLTAVISFRPSSWQFWSLMTAAVCGLIAVIRVWPRRMDEDPEVAAIRAKLTAGYLKNQEQAEAFEKARTLLLSDLENRTHRLDERERSLVTRFARFQEFLEYPIEDVHAERVSGALQKLSDQDRQVREILEAEAERVYEKIRRNGYTVNGRVDDLAIRNEALELVKRVAKVYKPECENPLLETSFEQLARAASRICLHTLVLLEQLPVQVQHYNINTLYSYIRKAVVGYGVYQQATPWFKYLSRGIYAGRMVSTANPATLGAWWLATELGKRGAQMVVENVVDRQAVALLHELVTIIGVEAAGIYGTGFRQRDSAWIFGTELVELIQSFPASGESLKAGLQIVTTLPLRSEYDRVYLYRCLANHRSAGLHLADSAMLTREEREIIANKLEQFFKTNIHGAKESRLKRWREGFEQRFDLRLKLTPSDKSMDTSRDHQIEQASRSLIAFLRYVMRVDDATVLQIAGSFRTLALLSDAQRVALLKQLTEKSFGDSFDVPELEPSSPVTDAFLHDLAACTSAPEQPDEHAETVVAETWGYFRRPASDALQSIAAAWKQKIVRQSLESTVAEDLPPEAVRAFFLARRPDERLAFAYTGLSRRQTAVVQVMADHWLFGTESLIDKSRRAFVTSASRSGEIIWVANIPFSIERVHGMLIDDAAISNGSWLLEPSSAEQHGPGPDLLISGNLRGGRFRSYFRRLLEFSGASVEPQKPATDS